METETTGNRNLTTFKDNIKNFYRKNKFLIISLLSIIIITAISINFYFNFKAKEKLILGELYVQAKIDIQNNKREEGKNALIKVINENDNTYSPLSLFLIIDKKLIKEDEKLVELFNHVLNNNQFDDEIKNLIIYKKTLIESGFLNEEELLKSVNPLIKLDSIWKPHALLLLGDYFFFKNEFNKAKENYLQVLPLTKNQDYIHQQARNKLAQISSHE